MRWFVVTMHGSHLHEPVQLTMPVPWSVMPAIVAMGLAFFLYFWTAAPGLTWSYFAADGGELLAAAVSSGVAHPPGYPLYIQLLRIWLVFGRIIFPSLEIARLGNLLNVFLAASCVPLVVLTAQRFCSPTAIRWQIPFLVGLLWAISPLFWQQALVTEVYALHMLMVASLGYLLLVKSWHPLALAAVIGLGMAHHGTYALLLPAVYYLIASGRPRPRLSAYLAPIAGVVGASATYLYIPFAAGASPPPPVNWGYADNWQGFLWLVSGAAYRQYLFSVPWSHTLGRISGWANIIATQYSAIGLAIALLGLAEWDRKHARLRTFSLLWILPISIYAISYNTQDSNIYLLPVSWLCAIWLAVGINQMLTWSETRWHMPVLPVVGLVCLLLFLAFGRIPATSLRGDAEARTYVEEVTRSLAAVQPAPVIVSTTDRHTFALWYATWATGELFLLHPDIILVNSSLYQYGWYRRLLEDLYSDISTAESDFSTFLSGLAAERPVLFTEPLPDGQPDQYVAVGALWQTAK